jgi:hypothetical protein
MERGIRVVKDCSLQMWLIASHAGIKWFHQSNVQTDKRRKRSDKARLNAADLKNCIFIEFLR